MKSKLKPVNLIYIGDEFYSKSGTMMSSVYTEDWDRYDWGFMQRDLRNGAEVHIRQATDGELGIAYRMLRKWEEKKG